MSQPELQKTTVCSLVSALSLSWFLSISLVPSVKLTFTFIFRVFWALGYAFVQSNLQWLFFTREKPWHITVDVEIDRCSSVDGLEGQHHRLESVAGRNRKPAEVTEELGHMEEFGKIVNEAHCSILNTLQRFSRRCWESSQEEVAVVQVGDDRILEQKLPCILWGKTGSWGGCRGQICRLWPQ